MGSYLSEVKLCGWAQVSQPQTATGNFT